MSSGYPEFRRKLDAVLRQRDPQALRAFLVGEGQWDADTTTDPERAMWMMIATSPALANLRDDAIAWLAAHGHAEEARELGGPHPPTPSPARRGGASGGPGTLSSGKRPTGSALRAPGRPGKPGHARHPGKPPRRDA